MCFGSVACPNMYISTVWAQLRMTGVGAALFCFQGQDACSSSAQFCIAGVVRPLRVFFKLLMCLLRYFMILDMGALVLGMPANERQLSGRPLLNTRVAGCRLVQVCVTVRSATGVLVCHKRVHVHCCTSAAVCCAVAFHCPEVDVRTAYCGLHSSSSNYQVKP
jgi:hypothetical protein